MAYFYRKVCEECGAAYECGSPRQRLCDACRERHGMRAKNSAYAEECKEMRNKIQKCRCCGAEFTASVRRILCNDCMKLPIRERKKRMSVRDHITNTTLETGMESAYVREDGVIVLPPVLKKDRSRRPAVNTAKPGSINDICWRLEELNEKRRKNGKTALSYGKFINLEYISKRSHARARQEKRKAKKEEQILHAKMEAADPALHE